MPGVRVQRTRREQIVPRSKLGGKAVAVLFPDFLAAMQQLRPKAAISTRPIPSVTQPAIGFDPN